MRGIDPRSDKNQSLVLREPLDTNTAAASYVTLAPPGRISKVMVVMATTLWLLLVGVVAASSGSGLRDPQVVGWNPGSSVFLAPGLGASLGAATGSTLANLPESVRLEANHFYLCFSGPPDEAFIRRLWAVSQAPVSVWAAPSWRAALGRFLYRDGATHVLVGGTLWLSSSLRFIRDSVVNRTVNIKKTQWLFVSTEPEDGVFKAQLESHIPEKLNVFLLQSYTPRADPSPSRKRRRNVPWEETEEDIHENTEARKRERKSHKDQKASYMTNIVTTSVVHQPGAQRTPPCSATYDPDCFPVPEEKEKEEDSNENLRKQLFIDDVAENNQQSEGESSSKQKIMRNKDGRREIKEKGVDIDQNVNNARGWMNTAHEQDPGKIHKSSGASRFRRQTRGWYPSISRTKRQENIVGVMSSSPVEPGVSLHVAMYPGDGSVTLKRAGVWRRSSGMVLRQQIQPRSSGFHGRDLVLTTVHKPRVFEVRGQEGQVRSSLREVDGYVAEVVRVLERRLNFTAVVTATNTFGSQLLNGSWNGMLGFLTRGEADMSPLDFSPSWARAQAIDFSEWFSTDGVIIISKTPDLVQLPFLLLQIFSGWVWLSIVAVGVVTGNLLWAFDYILHYDRSDSLLSGRGAGGVYRQRLSYGGAVAATLKLFLNQSSRTWCTSWSGRMLCSCLFLVVVSVVALYQGYIIAFLAVPRTARPIDSATHLMDRLPDVTPIVRKNTVYYRFVVNFESYSPIAANLKFHQDSFLNTWDFFQLIHQGKYALIDTYSSGVGRAARFESSSDCRFHISRQVLKADLDLMAHPQNSVFRENIDQALRRLRSFGIVEKIKNQYYSTSCSQELTQRDPIALTLTQVQSAFYLLAAGFIISLMEFILEVTYSFCNR
ncbi:glutamate receptor-like isoform X2 [Panulirus ornatus]|uniref:glutamate receptor-like isoform X2 n=1 Tax=Panulirus ornatus TaxID=150431 RepID=UPI003A8736C6